MSTGFGAAFFGITLFGILLVIACLLLAATGVTATVPTGRMATLVPYVTLGLVGIAGLLAVFGIFVLADEAPRLAALLGVLVLVPLVLVAGRVRWAGSSWLAVGATAGMAWSLPFLVAIGLLFVLQTATDVSTLWKTIIAGIVTIGGTVLSGGYVGASVSRIAE